MPGTVLQFSSRTWLYDIKLLEGASTELPELDLPHLTVLLYVFSGTVAVNQTVSLNKLESLIIKDEVVHLNATEDTELVLFITDEKAPIFKGGMYSGNKI